LLLSITANARAIPKVMGTVPKVKMVVFLRAVRNSGLWKSFA